MKKHLLFFVLLFFAFSGFSQTTWTWIGGGGGDWNVAANWVDDSPTPMNTVPATGGIVELTGIGTATLTNSGAIPNPSRILVKSNNYVTIDFSINIGDGTIIQHGVKPQGNASITFGDGTTPTIVNINVPSNRDAFQLDANTNPGNVTVESNTTVNITGGDTGILMDGTGDHVFTNNGTLSISGVDNGGVITDATAGNGTFTFINNGTMTTNGSGTPHEIEVGTGHTFTNNGTLTTQGGSTAQRIYVDGIFDNAIGATLDFKDDKARIRVNNGMLTNKGLIKSDYESGGSPAPPIFRVGTATGTIVNDAFFDNTDDGSANLASGGLTDNGINLNEIQDAGGLNSIDLGDVSYSYSHDGSFYGTTVNGLLDPLPPGELTTFPDAVLTLDAYPGFSLTITNANIAAYVSGLPIELLSFNAKLIDKKNVMVTWQTASELNNDYMVVEHSMDGTDFREVGRVAGVGTTNVLNHYELEHRNPETGFNYYRLRQVDFDGKMDYSEIVQVKLNLLDAPIRVFPTVVDAELTIDLTNVDVEKVNIQVLNINGQVLRNIENESNVNVLLQTSQFSSGMYFVRISGNGLETQTHRFVKR